MTPCGEVRHADEDPVAFGKPQRREPVGACGDLAHEAGVSLGGVHEVPGNRLWRSPGGRRHRLVKRDIRVGKVCRNGSIPPQPWVRRQWRCFCNGMDFARLQSYPDFDAGSIECLETCARRCGCQRTANAYPGLAVKRSLYGARRPSILWRKRAFPLKKTPDFRVWRQMRGARIPTPRKPCIRAAISILRGADRNRPCHRGCSRSRRR